MEHPLQSRIAEFLLGLNLSTPPNREALLVWASLDQELVNQIDCSGPADQFVPLLVSRLMQYGRLEDGRDALESVLRAAREKTGMDGKATCDTLIQDWRISNATIGVPNTVVDDSPQRLDYKYDVFLSYGHRSMFSRWIGGIFLHRFEGYLGEYLVRPVRIGKVQASWGHDVPTYTKIALAHSRCLVAICYPTYFKSPLRTYEMAVMLQRERRLGYRTESNPNPLLLLVYAFDGEWFPEIIARRKRRCDCNGLTSTSVERSERGVMLDDRIKQLAAEAANTIGNVPPWTRAFFDDLTPDRSIVNSLDISSQYRSLPRW